jgi:hypothetical protein
MSRMRGLVVLTVVVTAALLAAPAPATNPPDARIVAGSMPGFPHAVAQRYGVRAVPAARRRTLVKRFAGIRIGAPGAGAVALLGRIHKVLHYTQAGNACDYFDGGFVLCIAGGRVAAKGYETSY